MEKIRVGIKTNGIPRINKKGDLTLVHNMLIGDGFHWEKTIEATLPGLVEAFEPPVKQEETKRLIPHDNVSLINTLPLESYLECVVGSEMNPEAPVEFLKAHAVISRSWALGKVMGENRYGEQDRLNDTANLIGWDDDNDHEGFHVCSDDHCQRYQGLQPISSTALRAIKETAGEVLTAPDGSIVDARFSKCCGGRTELFSTCWQPVEVACIESFDDPWCDLSGLTSADRHMLLSTILKDYDLDTEGYGYIWHSEITKEEIRKNLLNRFGRSVGEIQRLEPLHRGPSGRIDILRIHGSEGIMDIGKELWIRRLLSSSHLYSSAFEIEDRGECIALHGHGWGHGAGLCQIGAANMAFHGHDYRSILSFYYPGSQIITKN